MNNIGQDPRIEICKKKKLVGKSVKMSLSRDRTFELWSSFMPGRKRISNVLGSDLYSLQVYNSFDLNTFTTDTEFTKHALIEVSDFNIIPDDLQQYVLNGGLYAVFLHRGLAEQFPKTLEFIFFEWLPSSDYTLDDREHFEVLGEHYKRNDPTSEEEVWVPIKPKSGTSIVSDD